MSMIDQLEQQGKKLVNKIKNLQSSSIDGFKNRYLNDSYPDVPIANISAKTFNNTRLLDQKISELNKLKVDYNKAVDEYSFYLANSTESARNYIARTDPSNPLLNKNIQFSDGKTMYVTQQGIAKLYKDPSNIDSISGRNGCPLSKKVVKFNKSDPNYNKPGFNLITTKPLLKVGSNMENGQSCGKEGQNVFVNSLLEDTPTPVYNGCFKDDPKNRSMKFLGNNPGNNAPPEFDFNGCKDSAISGGYKYFSLQGANIKTGKGYCAVGNDINSATKKGKATITKKFPIWASNTKATEKAVLQNTGSLVVLDSSDKKSWYSSPMSKCVQMYSTTKTSDSGGNDIDFLNGSIDDCKTQCNTMNNCGGFVYDNNGKYCYIKSGNVNPSGTNANLDIYKKSVDTESCFFYLILQNDGNMCIYRDGGSGPSKNPGNSVWCSHTNGKKQMSNSEWVSTNGKYQRNYLMTGESLSVGEWIGSDDGSLKLILEETGNLVLYTSTTVENCSKMSDGIMGGGVNANAIYDLGSVGFPKNMGKVGFVDENGVLKEYPSSMIDSHSTHYLNSLSGAPLSAEPVIGTTFEYGKSLYFTKSSPDDYECKKLCDSDPKCKGITVVNGDSVNSPYTVCMLTKNSLGSPMVFKEENPLVKTYYHSPELKNSSSCPKDVSTIDSVQWENYVKSSEKMSPSTDCTNGELNITKDEVLLFLEKKMKNLSKKIADQTDYLLSNRLSVKQQTTMNSITLNSALVSSFPVQYDDNTTNIQKYKKANSAFREGFNSDSNINKIVQDSHIRVMQENYEYILWGALAITTVVVFIKLLKN